MKPVLFLFMLIPGLLKTCAGSGGDDDRVRLAKVGSEAVYLDEALQGMPVGLSASDSATYVRQFVRDRVKDLLIYEKAVENIPQNQELEDLVENYRRSLIIYEYQQQVLNEKMRTEISESEMMDFYKSNIVRFTAVRNLVKGTFIKVPKNAPDLEKLKRLYKSSSAESFEKMEKYCVQNAGQFEYFYDKWVSFDDIMDNIPYTMGSQSDFLKSRSALEVVENDFCYLLYINDYVLSGNIAPFDYVRDDVKNVMINSRKTAFIHQFEQTLLKEAQKKKKIVYDK
ncbi:MAG: peptidyl-prolyl cis-trans isomerase [Bacteroidales bacterium]|nr:peptidyl-prolyl cis-trans isomerase [Bacteroidales bacterium]